jgi:hypothetical protein
MRPFSFHLNESFAVQGKSYLDSTFGDSEYKAVLKANPIAFIDGLMTLTITTKEKPQNTNPTSLTQTIYGWVSSYKKNHLN